MLADTYTAGQTVTKACKYVAWAITQYRQLNQAHEALKKEALNILGIDFNIWEGLPEYFELIGFFQNMEQQWVASLGCKNPDNHQCTAKRGFFMSLLPANDHLYFAASTNPDFFVRGLSASLGQLASVSSAKLSKWTSIKDSQHTKTLAMNRSFPSGANPANLPGIKKILVSMAANEWTFFFSVPCQAWQPKKVRACFLNSF